MTRTIATLALAGLAAAASADITDLRITEMFPGQPTDPNGTSDWFELTNYSANTVSTGGLFSDADSFDPTKDDALDALTLAPGESAVFLVSWEDDFTVASDAIDEFVAFWGLSGSDVQVGVVNGGSGLGGGGDAAAIFAGNTAGAQIVSTAAFVGDVARSTIDYAAVDPSKVFRTPLDSAPSNAPLAWAFESVGGAGAGNETVFGSPGAIPTPGAVSVLGLAGLAAARRRR